jgi:hypothetical protein
LLAGLLTAAPSALADGSQDEPHDPAAAPTVDPAQPAADPTPAGIDPAHPLPFAPVTPTIPGASPDDPSSGFAPSHGGDSMSGLASSETVDAPPAASDLPEGVDANMPELAPGPKEPKPYGAYLAKLVRVVRGKVRDKLDAKLVAGQEKAMDRLSLGFSILSALGLLCLLTPAIVGKKYPGKGGVLFKYSVLSTVMWIVTINLMSGVVMLLRSAQAIAGQITNPQIAVVDAVFNVMEKKADEIVAVGHSLVQPTLAQLAGGSDEMPVVLLLENAKHLKQELGVFLAMAKFFKSISFLFEYIPIVMTAIAVVSFAVAAKPTLTQIVKLPMLAAGGESGAGARVVKDTFKRIARELVATLILIVFLVVVTLMGGLLLTDAVEPAVEALLTYLFAAVLYVQLAPDASSFWILLSLGLAGIFLVLNIAVVVVPSGAFLGKVHKIFQRRLHEKEPLGTHMKFFCFAPLSLAWTVAFPMFFGFVAPSLSEWITSKCFDAAKPNWTALLVSGPTALVVGFLLAFAIFGGLPATLFLLRYRVVPKAKKQTGDAAKEASPAAAAAMA